jgi:hypothetical protein
MKEKLLERIGLLEQAYVKQQKLAEQAMADLNAIAGARQELMHILSLMDQDEKAKEDEKVCEPVPLEESAMCEAV